MLNSTLVIAQDTKVGICTDTEQSDSRQDLAAEERAHDFDYRMTRFTNRVTADDVLIDVRERNNTDNARIEGALNIPLFSIKTKQYLKRRRIVLVGDGLDYSGLQAEVAKLEKLKFRHVRILRHGAIGLTKTVHLLPDRGVAYELHMADAEALFTAAHKRINDFIFLNLNENNEVFRLLGLKSQSFEQSEATSKTKWIELQIEAASENLEENTVVIVAETDQQYRDLFFSKPSFPHQNVRFLQGGLASLQKLHQSLRHKIDSQGNSKRKCQA